MPRAGAVSTSTRTDRSATGAGGYDNVIAVGVENHPKPMCVPSGNTPSPHSALAGVVGTPRIRVILTAGLPQERCRRVDLRHAGHRATLRGSQGVAGVAMELGTAFEAEILLVLAYERRLVTSLGTRDPRPGMEACRASNRAWEALSRLSAGLEAEYGSRPKTRAVLGDAAAVLQKVAEEGGRRRSSRSAAAA